MAVTFEVSQEALQTPGKKLNLESRSVFKGIEALGNILPEAAGSNAEKLVPYSSMNGFLGTAHLAYNKHYPLVLSPDDVWLTIAQGFAAHVNKNAEKLRKQFVAHEGKKYIEIQRNSFVKGSPENDWQGCFAEFSDKIAEHIGKKRDLLVGNYTTTGPVEKAASELVLMDAMKSYFDYGVRTLCGIPSITLLGERSDWENMVERARALSEFDCVEWSGALVKVLDVFVAAHRGVADPKVWNNLLKIENHGSGGPSVTGFINVFFPYFDRGRGGIHANYHCLTSLQALSGNGSHNGPNTSDYPSGLSSTPFKWHYYNTTFEMQFVGGFVGISQNDETLAVRPAIGWGITDAPSAA